MEFALEDRDNNSIFEMEVEMKPTTSALLSLVDPGILLEPEPDEDTILPSPRLSLYSEPTETLPPTVATDTSDTTHIPSSSNISSSISNSNIDVKIGGDPGNCCANCKAPHDSTTSKKFTELLPMQYFNTTTGDYTDIEIIEAICEVFKIRWTCVNFSDVFSKDTLELCNECSRILVQLYRFYTSFAAITVKTKSFLSTVINFQKDLSTLENVVVQNESNGIDCYDDWFYTSTEMTDNVEEYQQDDSLVTHVAAETEENKVTAKKSVPPKKRGSRKVTRKSCPKNGTAGKQKTKTLSMILRRLTPSQLKTTTKKVTNDTVTLNCRECEKVFKFPIQLRIHLNSVSHKEKIKQQVNAQMSQVEKSSVSRKSEKMSKLDSQEPQPKATRVTTEKKRTRRAAGSSPRKRSNQRKKNKTCPVCSKSYSRTRGLQKHMLKHQPKQKGEGVKCERCDKKFDTEGGLKIHFAAHVRDDNKHICKDCGKKFRKLEALEHHEKVDHGGYKPHECPQCGKCFRLKDKLKLHVLSIHERKNPYPCTKCDKSFRSKYHLKIHDVAVHIKGVDASLGCSQCKRKFSDREALEKHVLIHQQDKPHICSKCNKGFQTSARLKLHEKSHQEMPSCVCHICGRAYKHIRDLKLHEVSHQDESTFRFGCGDCEKKFYRIDLLRAHQSNKKHFSDDVIGPSPALREKAMGSKESTNFYDLPNNDAESDDDEDEFENGNETIIETLKAKKRRVTKPRQRKHDISTISVSHDSLNTTASHSSGAVMYQPPPLIPIHFDEQQSVRNNNTIQFIPRTETNTDFGFNHRDRMQSHSQTQSQSQPQHLHHSHSHSIPNPAHQLQIQTLSGHPPSQFGNAYLIREIGADRGGSGSMPAAEQIGFDVISSFINNLG